MESSQHINQSSKSRKEDFLAGLPADTKEFIYGNFRSLRNRIDESITEMQEGRMTAEFIVFLHVPPGAFEKMEPRHVAHGRISYDQSLAIMIVKLPSVPHEAVARAIEQRLTLQYPQMGLETDDLTLAGSATYEGTRSSKEADGSWIPAVLPDGRERSWPTVVVEVGFSESYSRLKIDAQWWLEESRGDVQLVILVNIDRGNETIAVEKWELRGSSYEVLTRSLSGSGSRDVPTMTYQAQVTRQPNGNITVVNAPMTLPFSSFFLRDPVPPEADFVLTGNDLTRITRPTFDAL